VGCQQAVDRIRAETERGVEIKIFANSALGGDTDMLSQSAPARSSSAHLAAGFVLVRERDRHQRIGIRIQGFRYGWAAMDPSVTWQMGARKSGSEVSPDGQDLGMAAIARLPAAPADQLAADLSGFKIRVRQQVRSSGRQC